MHKQKSHYEIYIDKDGIWYFRGTEMQRQDIVRYFYQYFRRDEDGNYLVEIDDDRCYIGVEDTPYVIRSVSVVFSQDSSQPYVELSLNDGSSERLNPSVPLRIGADHILYCWVKRGEYEARFSRPAYYQLCEHIQYDPGREEYVLTLDQHSYSLILNEEATGKTSPSGNELYKHNANGGYNVR